MALRSGLFFFPSPTWRLPHYWPLVPFSPAHMANPSLAGDWKRSATEGLDVGWKGTTFRVSFSTDTFPTEVSVGWIMRGFQGPSGLPVQKGADPVKPCPFPFLAPSFPRCCNLQRNKGSHGAIGVRRVLPLPSAGESTPEQQRQAGGDPAELPISGHLINIPGGATLRRSKRNRRSRRRLHGAEGR